MYGSKQLSLASQRGVSVSGLIVSIRWTSEDAPSVATVSASTADVGYASQPDTAASWSYLQTATLWSLSGRDDWTGAPVLPGYS